MTSFTEAVEKMYDVKFVGYYDLPNKGEYPWYVFWTDTPDKSKGHSNYMAVQSTGYNTIRITCGAGIEDQIFRGIEINAKRICSRYRHDFQQEGPAFIDGGADYQRYNPNHPPTHVVRVVDGKEVWEELV
jgi:hypothetical protein